MSRTPPIWRICTRFSTRLDTRTNGTAALGSMTIDMSAIATSGRPMPIKPFTVPARQKASAK